MGNAIVHVELIGPEPERLRRFYSALFGWNAAAGAPVAPAVSEATQYSFIEPPADAAAAAGGIGGGLGFSAHAIFYVGVADVSSALHDAERLGGTVVMTPHRNEGTQITVGHFRDPAGNLVGVAGPR